MRMYGLQAARVGGQLDWTRLFQLSRHFSRIVTAPSVLGRLLIGGEGGGQLLHVFLHMPLA